MSASVCGGVSLKGGKKDLFYFCAFEFFPDSQRWFLRSLLKVKEISAIDGNAAISNWIKLFNPSVVVVDVPQTLPACQTCLLACPGAEKCPVESIVSVRESIDYLLAADKKLYDSHPKTYENRRLDSQLLENSRNYLEKESTEHLLTRSFKRKLKKGYLPYWNRTLDFWIWMRYYDLMLEIFNHSYDGLGHIPSSLIFRLNYLKKQLPSNLKLFEGNFYITLIELYKAGIISVQSLKNLSDIDNGVNSRISILRCLEEELELFIYEKDSEEIIKDPRAFESFILSVGAIRAFKNKNHSLPDWTLPSETKFLSPNFK